MKLAEFHQFCISLTESFVLIIIIIASLFYCIIMQNFRGTGSNQPSRGTLQTCKMIQFLLQRIYS